MSDIKSNREYAIKVTVACNGWYLVGLVILPWICANCSEVHGTGDGGGRNYQLVGFVRNLHVRYIFFESSRQRDCHFVLGLEKADAKYKFTPAMGTVSMQIDQGRHKSYYALI